MAVNARLYQDLRGSARHQVALDATLRDPQRRPFDVVVEELSATGVRVPAVLELAPGALITLGIAGIGMCDARVLRREAHGYGCEFLYPLSDAELAEAVAASPADPVVLADFAPLPAALPSMTLKPRGHPDLLGVARVGVVLALAAACWTALYGALSLTS